ncbi:MAG: ArnT family glycosyltransferase, partial [Chloroflexia bacterium]
GTEQTGRVLAGLFDTLTTLLVFAAGLRLWGMAAGLVASALYALAVLPIHLGHMYISDPFMVFFMTAGLLGSLLFYQTRRTLFLLVAGFCLGLAMACKLSAASALVLPLAAIALPSPGSEGLKWKRGLGLGALAMAAAFVGLFLGDPFAVLDAPNYLSQIGGQLAIQSGADDRWFTRRYVGTWPVAYPWGQLVLLGVGPMVGIAGTLGAGLVAVQAWRRRGGAEALLLLGAATYFATIAFAEAKWVRYLLPLVPYLCLFATALALRLWNAAASSRAGPILRYAVPVLLIGSALVGALAFRAIYGVEHTRVQASRWIYGNVPPGSAIAIEINDGLMPRALPGHPNPEQDYHVIWLRTLADFPSAEASAMLRDQLAQADYLVYSPVRPERTVARMPWRYPVQNRYYNLLLSGRLGFTPVYTATSYPSIFGLEIPDDNDWVDASFIEYDHPPVQVFKKERTLSRAELDTLFADAVRQPSVATRHAP